MLAFSKNRSNLGLYGCRRAITPTLAEAVEVGRQDKLGRRGGDAQGRQRVGSATHDIVVQEHQGTISVDTAVGQYAEFIITLPKQVPSLSEAPGPPSAR